MKLDVKAFAITCSLLWGVGLCLATLWILMMEGPSTNPTFIGRIYLGYSLTATGAFIGLAWGLVDGAVGGAIFAWLYNRLVKA